MRQLGARLLDVCPQSRLRCRSRLFLSQLTRPAALSLLALLALSIPALTQTAPSFPPAPPLTTLNLSPEFQSQIQARNVIDLFHSTHYATEAQLGPTPKVMPARRFSLRPGILKVLPPVDTQTSTSTSVPPPPTHRSIPPRGYRPQISSTHALVWPPQPLPDDLIPELRERIEGSLASKGLLATLLSAAQHIHQAQPSALESPNRFASKLSAAGLPLDLFELFLPPASSQSQAPSPATAPTPSLPATTHQWLEWAIQTSKDSSAASPPTLLPQLQLLPKLPTLPVTVAPEVGNLDSLLFRMQLGGGYNQGIVPGSGLDVIGSLCETAPDTPLVVSAEKQFASPLSDLAARSWNLRKTGQLTILTESLPVSSWAQDNTKPAWTQTGGLAVLIPRYASVDEGFSRIVPGDTAAAVHLHRAGFQVVQSPLLFQGGNLVVVEEPTSHERVLMLGEGELWRNQALGLSRDHILALFQHQFACNRVQILPNVSYHLDFDACFRVQDNRPIVFVNDARKGASLIVQIGLQGFLQALREDQTALREDLLQFARANQLWDLRITVQSVLKQRRISTGRLQLEIVDAFAVSPVDSASVNLQCFLNALDFMVCDLPQAASALPSADAQYLQALHQFKDQLTRQTSALALTGWTVVGIPSLPELNRGINYINVVQDKTRLFVPAWGGFYADLDRAAQSAYQAALGPLVRIIPIQCADTQRTLGGLHCLVSTHPKPAALLSGPHSPSSTPLSP